MERLVIMADSKPVQPDALPSYFLEDVAIEKTSGAEQRNEPLPISPGQTEARSPRLEDLERKEVAAALKRHGWVRARAARELGITQRQIGYRIKKYELQPPDYI
jgi:Nif-specific regulatory protein